MNRVIETSPADRLQTVKPSWERGLVFVCRECDGDAKALRRGLKHALEEAGLRKRVRVVACGCLDVCPRRATTVVAIGEGRLECSIVRDADPFSLRRIVRRFESSSPGKRKDDPTGNDMRHEETEP